MLAEFRPGDVGQTRNSSRQSHGLRHPPALGALACLIFDCQASAITPALFLVDLTCFRMMQ